MGWLDVGWRQPGSRDQRLRHFGPATGHLHLLPRLEVLDILGFDWAWGGLAWASVLHHHDVAVGARLGLGSWGALGFGYAPPLPRPILVRNARHVRLRWDPLNHHSRVLGLNQRNDGHCVLDWLMLAGDNIPDFDAPSGHGMLLQLDLLGWDWDLLSDDSDLVMLLWRTHAMLLSRYLLGVFAEERLPQRRISELFSVVVIQSLNSFDSVRHFSK